MLREGELVMTYQLIDVVFIPLAAAVITAIMIGVSLLIARKEAREGANTTPQADAMIEGTMRKAS